LAGRVQSSSKIEIEADIRLGDQRIDPSQQAVRRTMAFVAQEDSLQVTSTPREAIRFSARMRLPVDRTDEEIDEMTNRMVKELGLEKAADTVIGGALLKGISGGERKRTAVGVELVVQPTLIFLDEPTTGLDSYSAIAVVQILKRVATSGSAVALTIHQPASEIVQLLDELILLRLGSVLYQGPVADIPRVFENAGLPLPSRYNPADWMLHVAQTITTDKLAEGLYPKDIREFPPLPPPSRSGSTGTGEGRGKKVSQLSQIAALTKRELINLYRFPDAIFMRWGGDTILALLISLIYKSVGETDRSVQSNIRSIFGALVFSQLMGLFGCAEPSLMYFPQDRPVFLREYATNHYSVTSYFLSRTFIESVLAFVQITAQSLLYVYVMELNIPFWEFVGINYVLSMAGTGVAVFIGSIVEDPRTATELLPLVLVPQLLFAGFFVSIDNIPSWLQWAQYLCALTYSIRLAVIGEFSSCGDAAAQETCDEIFERNSVDPDDSGLYWGILVALFVVFRCAAMAALAIRAKHYL
jgi:ABC-type multidrug transport system ATPase subunit/ABC-type multidrug transport system permease subunit